MIRKLLILLRLSEAVQVRDLSQREQQVFHLMMMGKRTKEIAKCLNLSRKTVETYRRNTVKKLGGNRHDRKAMSRGEVRRNPWSALELTLLRLVALALLVGHRPKANALFSPPGMGLWRLAEFLCTKKTYDSVFVPLLADFHHEYFEALSRGEKWKARWLRVLYYSAFFKSAGLNVAMRFLREAWARFHKA
jgi:DNA-binding CsgD family transcriptional regulator